MKRYLCVWLPDWPLTRLRRSWLAHKTGKTQRRSNKAPEPKAPFVLLETGQHGLRVAAANAPACKLGVSIGQRFTDAKAICPNLVAEDIDHAANAAALSALADWLVRIAPIVAVDGPDGLMLETTGCAHLYGGEQAMLAEVSRLLTRDNIPHQLGLAGTVGAASALARTAHGTILPNGQEEPGLADLPMTALRLSDKTLTLLRRFGLTQIGQLYKIDRAALARRFRSRRLADDVLKRLDQALARRKEPLAPLRAPPDYTARLNCAEPIFTGEAILHGAEHMAETLCAGLSQLGQGARQFTLHAFRADGGVSSVNAALAHAARKPEHILHLLAQHIDTIDPGFGIDLLLLEARRVEPMGSSTGALPGGLAPGHTDTHALSVFADRITAKLGAGSVRIAAPVASHLPSRAAAWQSFEGTIPPATAPPPQAGPRPIRMFDTPERVNVLAEVPDGPPQIFIWRKRKRTIARADGPERLSPEWWRHTAPPPAANAPDGSHQRWLAPKLDPRADAALIDTITKDLKTIDHGTRVKNLPRARDYYRVEDTEGRRYWLYRNGLYGDGRGGPPDWFIHGLFA